MSYRSAGYRLRGFDRLPVIIREIQAALVSVPSVLVTSPRPAKLARELRREIGNLYTVTAESAGARVRRAP